MVARLLQKLDSVLLESSSNNTEWFEDSPFVLKEVRKSRKELSENCSKFVSVLMTPTPLDCLTSVSQLNMLSDDLYEEDNDHKSSIFKESRKRSCDEAWEESGSKAEQTKLVFQRRLKRDNCFEAPRAKVAKKQHRKQLMHVKGLNLMTVENNESRNVTVSKVAKQIFQRRSFDEKKLPDTTVTVKNEGKGRKGRHKRSQTVGTAFQDISSLWLDKATALDGAAHDLKSADMNVFDIDTTNIGYMAFSKSLDPVFTKTASTKVMKRSHRRTHSCLSS